MTTTPAKLAAPNRFTSIDAYRGLVMFLMMAEFLRIGLVATSFPENSTWQLLKFHTSHVAWAGCSLHDLIQPSFSFLVGTALAFSLVSRKAKGQSFLRMLLHAVIRAIVLVLLGVFLRSVNSTQTNFTFEDTLSQIGLGYVFLFLLGFAPMWAQVVALVVILAGYWGAFAWYPLPGPDFDYQAVKVPADWPHHYEGLAAHWNKNSNLAWKFDTWFLNLFPRPLDKSGEPIPFAYNDGGYATLSFIPTLGTMILGLLAGEWLRSAASNGRKFLYLLAAGAICMGAGYALDYYGICPNVKRIWTPAWTLFSGGWCFFLMAGFFLLTDFINFRAWAFPLVVIGANSIFIYTVVHLHWGEFIVRSFRTHFGDKVFKAFGDAYEPLVAGAAALIVYWLILFWMYRHRVFVKI